MPVSHRAKRAALGFGTPIAALAIYIWAACLLVFFGNAGWLPMEWFELLSETVFRPVWWYADSGLPGSKWLVDVWYWLQVANECIRR